MENVYWNYDVSMHSKGNEVGVYYIDDTNTQFTTRGTEDGGKTFVYNTDDLGKAVSDVKAAREKAGKTGGADPTINDTDVRQYMLDKKTARLAGGDEKIGEKETRLQSTIKSIDRVGQLGAAELAFTTTMDDMIISINNQWSEGNGANNYFSAAIDGVADMATNGIVQEVKDTIQQVGIYDFDKSGSKKDANMLMKFMANVNNQHYRTSTNFMKYFNGTNVSMPISIRRTFITDSISTDIASSLSRVAKICAGTQLPMSDMASGATYENYKAGVQQYVDDSGQSATLEYGAKQEASGDSFSNTFIDLLNTFGGIWERAPLGYRYRPQVWLRSFYGQGGVSSPSPDVTSERLGGTVFLKLPTGQTINGLLVYDASIQLSSQMVDTVAGLRPLTASVNISLVPARTWLINDLAHLIQFKNVK